MPKRDQPHDGFDSNPGQKFQKYKVSENKLECYRMNLLQKTLNALTQGAKKLTTSSRNQETQNFDESSQVSSSKSSNQFIFKARDLKTGKVKDVVLQKNGDDAGRETGLLSETCSSVGSSQSCGQNGKQRSIRDFFKPKN